MQRYGIKLTRFCAQQALCKCIFCEQKEMWKRCKYLHKNPCIWPVGFRIARWLGSRGMNNTIWIEPCSMNYSATGWLAGIISFIKYHFCLFDTLKLLQQNSENICLFYLLAIGLEWKTLQEVGVIIISVTAGVECCGLRKGGEESNGEGGGRFHKWVEGNNCKQGYNSIQHIVAIFMAFGFLCAFE